MAEKKCKYCAMMIPAEAKLCPYCRKKQTSTLLIAYIAGFFLFIFLIAIISEKITYRENKDRDLPVSPSIPSQPINGHQTSDNSNRSVPVPPSILYQLTHGDETPKEKQRTVEKRTNAQSIPHTVSDIHVQALDFMNNRNKDQYKGRTIVITGVISNVFIPPLSVKMKMAKQGLSADTFIYFSDRPASDVTETLVGNGVSCHLDESLAAKASQIHSGQTITLRCNYRIENLLDGCTLANERPPTFNEECVKRKMAKWEQERQKEIEEWCADLAKQGEECRISAGQDELVRQDALEKITAQCAE